MCNTSGITDLLNHSINTYHKKWYHIPGVKQLVKKISRVCVLCQIEYAKTVQQQMGQLPAHQVTPSPPLELTCLVLFFAIEEILDVQLE